MKHRVTYIRDPSQDFNPEGIAVTKDALTLSSLPAAKEHRVTLDLSELPAELREVLLQCHELHVRWTSSKPYPVRAPYLSKISAGLHAFYTPREEGEADKICPALKKLFSRDLKCSSRKDSFTTPALAPLRSAEAASYQHYSYLSDLGKLSEYLERDMCKLQPGTCQDAALSLLSAQQLDIDFPAQTEAVVLSVRWAAAPSTVGTWSETVSRSDLRSKTIEVGVLSEEKAATDGDIKFAGLLTVLGEDDRPKPARFSCASRHLSLDTENSSFTTSFDAPTGLHPILRIQFPNLTPPANPTCKLYTYLTLPSTLFLDRYAFSDALFLNSHGLASLQSVSGATDLEAPEWDVQQWGSASLFELDPPPSATSKGSKAPSIDITIPLHLRYLEPTKGGYENITVPWPVVFYACDSQDEEASPFSSNPFDRVHLGWDGLFGERTVFYQVQAALGASAWTATVTVPVLDLDRAAYVEGGTVGVVLLGFAWLLWCLFRPLDTGRGSAVEIEGAAGDKKAQ